MFTDSLLTLPPLFVQQQSLKDPRVSTMLRVIRYTLLLCAAFYVTVASSGESLSVTARQAGSLECARLVLNSILELEGPARCV